MGQPNAYGIMFENPTYEVCYSRHIRCNIRPMASCSKTQYMCSKTLSTLGLSDEINRMFRILGVLEFMNCEALTFERITLEFLSYMDFKLQQICDGTNRCHSGTMTFRLYNTDHQLTVEKLGGIL